MSTRWKEQSSTLTFFRFAWSSKGGLKHHKSGNRDPFRTVVSAVVKGEVASAGDGVLGKNNSEYRENNEDTFILTDICILEKY